MNIQSCAHLTTTHNRFDTRIYHKMCKSLEANGYKVNLLVADGAGDQKIDNISIYDVGKPKNRFDRMFKFPLKLFLKSLSIPSDIFHLHDPELIYIGYIFRLMNKKVIFDSHEDVTTQMLSKPYLNKFHLKVIARVYEFCERILCRKFDGIIAATPHIASKLSSINNNVVEIKNYPMLLFSNLDEIKLEDRDRICYVGGLEKIRGLTEVCEAMQILRSKARLTVCGSFGLKDYENLIYQHPGWQNNVDYLGYIGKTELKKVFQRSLVGMVTLHPTPNYLDSLPVKLFEYMEAGIAVIASDFPLWREIIEGNNCGLLVNPLDPYEIADAIRYCFDNPEKVDLMGRNGRKAINEKYNWAIEEESLINFYQNL